MFRRLIAVLLSMLLLASTAHSDGATGELADALQLREVFDVLALEGDSYGREIEGEMFPGDGGAAWRAAVADIYAVDHILPDFVRAFSDDLAESSGDVASMLGFLRSDLGRKVTVLEVSARRALLDQAVEDAGRLKWQEMQVTDDARVARIREFVAVNDLIDSNVTSALNASYAFYQGLADAGAFGHRSSEAEMLRDVWAQEPSIREETDAWIHAYLALAYAPLSDAELKGYIAFSGTPPGRDLNHALFAGFDKVFWDVSRELGRAAGGILVGQDL